MNKDDYLTIIILFMVFSFLILFPYTCQYIQNAPMQECLLKAQNVKDCEFLTKSCGSVQK